MCLCACVNYTCTASALSAAAYIVFFRRSTTPTVECSENISATCTAWSSTKMRIQDDWPPGSVPQRTAPHSCRAGEKFPQATKSDIMYLGGVTLHIHAKATKPMHAKLKHQVSCRSRRCRKKFSNTPCTDRQMRLRTSPQSQSPARSPKSQSSRQAARKVAVRPAMKPTVLGRPGSKLPPKKYELLNKKSTAPETEQRKHPPTRTTTQGQRCSRHTLARLNSSSITAFVHGSFATTEGPEDVRPLR